MYVTHDFYRIFNGFHVQLYMIIRTKFKPNWTNRSLPSRFHASGVPHRHYTTVPPYEEKNLIDVASHTHPPIGLSLELTDAWSGQPTHPWRAAPGKTVQNEKQKKKKKKKQKKQKKFLAPKWIADAIHNNEASDRYSQY